MPSDTLYVPVPSDILQTISNSVHSMLDWQNSSQFLILHDRLFTLAGDSTNVTASTNQCWAGEISLAPIHKRSEFGIGVTTGSNQIYCLFISDSALTPFPQVNFSSRVTFSDD